MSRPISTVPVPLNPWIPLIQVLPGFVSWLSLLSRLSKENASLFFTLQAPSTNSRSPYFLSCSRPNLKLNSQQCGLYKRYCFLWVVIFFSTMSGFLLIFFFLCLRPYMKLVMSLRGFPPLWTDNSESILEMTSGLPSCASSRPLSSHSYHLVKPSYALFLTAWHFTIREGLVSPAN